jgi:hypothetical protein
MAKPLSVGHGARGQGQSIGDTPQVDQHEHQLVQDPHPQPGVRARFIPRLFQVTRGLTVAVVVQAHHGQQPQRFRPHRPGREPGDDRLDERAGLARVTGVEVALGQPDPAFRGVLPQADDQVKEFGCGGRRAARPRPGRARVQRG